MIIDYVSLIRIAFEARERSLCPYSGFAVGAAILCKSGEVYTGCNIECGSYSATVCAERVAIFKALSEGETDFTAIAIVGGNVDDEITDYCPPCGTCRQVLSEYCDADDFEIILAKSLDEYEIYSLSQLLPLAFTFE